MADNYSQDFGAVSQITVYFCGFFLRKSLIIVCDAKAHTFRLRHNECGADHPKEDETAEDLAALVRKAMFDLCEHFTTSTTQISATNM